MSQDLLECLQKKLGYVFRDKALLAQAFRHSSATSLTQQSYERLEFLGDRVLGLAVADLLYTTHPKETEGELARRHSFLVCEDVLSNIALDWDLENLIQGGNPKG